MPIDFGRASKIYGPINTRAKKSHVTSGYERRSYACTEASYL